MCVCLCVFECVWVVLRVWCVVVALLCRLCVCCCVVVLLCCVVGVLFACVVLFVWLSDCLCDCGFV